MPSVFSKIIAGDLPGRFVYSDDLVVGFLTIAPVRPGHTLIVPRQEVDQWTDATPELLTHCTMVAQRIGQAVKQAWQAPRAALLIAGEEVPHLHLHVWPAWDLEDYNIARADSNVSAESLDDAQAKIKAAL